MKQVNREDIWDYPVNRGAYRKAMDETVQSHIWKNTRNVIAEHLEPVLDALHGRFQFQQFMNEIAEAIKENLTDDLLRPGYGPGAHCYVASEVYYHYTRGRRAEVRPMNMRHEGASHWFILDNGEVVDLTADQFKTKPDYSKARGRGFLTKEPSKRARTLISRVEQSFQAE